MDHTHLFKATSVRLICTWMYTPLQWQPLKWKQWKYNWATRVTESSLESYRMRFHNLFSFTLLTNQYQRQQTSVLQSWQYSLVNTLIGIKLLQFFFSVYGTCIASSCFKWMINKYLFLPALPRLLWNSTAIFNLKGVFHAEMKLIYILQSGMLTQLHEAVYMHFTCVHLCTGIICC